MVISRSEGAFIIFSRHYGYWSAGDAGSYDIGNHGIGPIYLEYSKPSNRSFS